MSYQTTLATSGTEPRSGVEIAETSLLHTAADFEEQAPSILSGPRSFEGKTLWPLSMAARHLAIMLSEPNDTGPLGDLIVIKLLSELESDYRIAIADRRDQETATDLAFANVMRRTTGPARDLFRAQALRWLAKLDRAQRDEAAKLMEAIYKEANDSELISTAIAGGSPKN